MHSSGPAAGGSRHPAQMQANGGRPGEQARQRKRERPANNGSKLLTESENAVFFSMLGYDCYSLAAGIVQLLKPDQHKPRIWTKLTAGVVALVKDYGKRAYFLRLYDVFCKEMKWQQMLYKNFRALPTACPNLLYFEGDDCVFGLNFSSREEAETFRNHLDRRFQQEQKTQQRRPEDPRRMRGPGGPMGPQRGAHMMPGKTGITSQGVSGQQLMNLASSSKKKKAKKEKKTKLKKELISNPTNFQHKAHIGWDANAGFSQETYDTELMDNSVRDLLKAAGENPDRMTKDEIDFTYRFLTQYQKAPGGASEFAAPASQQRAGPPPPVRREASMAAPGKGQRPAAARPAKPQAPTAAAQGAVPGRPADMPPAPPAGAKPEEAPVVASALPPVSAAAPPPPPPPPAEAIAPTPVSIGGGKGDLLGAIRAGASLKSVSAEESDKSGGGSRDDVLAQIRQGTVLKPVDKAALEDRKTGTALEDIGGIAGALAKALKDIREKVHDSDESTDDDDENNDDEWASD